MMGFRPALDMKILWVSPFFLHPTDRGAQIRTLGILRELHRRHEIHFATLEDPAYPEGRERCHEYCTRFYAIPHRPPSRGSPGFLLQAAAGLWSGTPLAVSRYSSAPLRRVVSELAHSGGFDAKVCDFLASAENIPDLGDWVLFQHNVETTIWERHQEHAATPLLRFYTGMQARRMFRFERTACRRSAHVIAVSSVDAQRMRERFQIERVSDVATGVDLDHFRRGADAAPAADLVFTGSMDWLPNIDGVRWFVQEVLPLVRRERPDCSVVVAGRRPTAEVQAFAAQDPGVQVTGTVADIRPYLWGSSVAIVPLRIGGGTRLKIYESMAAGLPVVSTTVGAEGLVCHPGEDILLADSPPEFARACLDLLERADLRRELASRALDLVAARFSWDAVSRSFEEILRSAYSCASK